MTTIKSILVTVGIIVATTSGLAWGQTSDCDTGEEASVVFQYLSTSHWGANGLRLLTDGRYDLLVVSGGYQDHDRQWTSHLRLTPEEVTAFEDVLATIDFSGLQDEYDSEALARDAGPTHWCLSIGGEVRGIITYGDAQAPELQTAYDALQTAVTNHYGLAFVTSEWSLNLEAFSVTVQVPCDPETIPVLRDLFILFASFETEFGAREENSAAHEVLTMVRLLDGFEGSIYRLWSDNLLTIESGTLRMNRDLSEEEMSNVLTAIEAIDWETVAGSCP